MLGISVKSVWAHKRRLVGALLAVVFGVAFLSGTLLLGDTLRANFDSLFMQANGSTDVVVSQRHQGQRCAGSEQPRHRRRHRSSARSEASTASPRPCRTSRATASCSAATARRSAATVRRPAAANWVAIPSLNPYRLVEGRAPTADDEVVINRGAAKTGDLHIGDRRPRCSPRNRCGFASSASPTFGTADGFGPSTFTGLTLHAAQQHLTRQPGPGDRDPRRGRARRLARRLARAGSVPSAVDVQAITGAELAAENYAQVNSGFLGFVRTGLVVVRRDRAARRRVQHLQHVLDPRDATRPRSRAAAGARCAPPPDRHGQRGRDARRRPRRLGGRLGRRRRARRAAQGGLRRLRLRAAGRRTGLQAVEHGDRLVAGVVATARGRCPALGARVTRRRRWQRCVSSRPNRRS